MILAVVASATWKDTPHSLSNDDKSVWRNPKGAVVRQGEAVPSAPPSPLRTQTGFMLRQGRAARHSISPQFQRLKEDLSLISSNMGCTPREHQLRHA